MKTYFKTDSVMITCELSTDIVSSEILKVYVSAAGMGGFFLSCSLQSLSSV